ncbi:MAG: STAS domain-containing protein [Planctomycetota bacterium]|nr:STAS domain-containing protein [Planctomycetota bacterium]
MTESSDQYTFEPADGYAIVTLHPSLHEARWAAIETVGTEFIEKFAGQELKSVVVDLGQLPFMGSSLVALLVRIWKAAQATKGQMVVVNANEMVLEVLTLAGLTSVWTIRDTREEGIHELGFSKPALNRKRETRFVGLVGPLSCLAALIIFAVDWAMPEQIASNVLQSSLYGCAGLGVVTSLLTAIRLSGGRQKLSVVSLLLSLAILVVGFLKIQGHIQLPELSGSNRFQEIIG